MPRFLDLVDRDPELLLPVQERPSCIWARVVRDLVCELAKVAGATCSMRLIGFCGGTDDSLTPLGSARPRGHRGADDSLA